MTSWEASRETKRCCQPIANQSCEAHFLRSLQLTLVVFIN
jgi:hypothetical protein